MYVTICRLKVFQAAPALKMEGDDWSLGK